MHLARIVMITALVLALSVIAPARAGDELSNPGEATRPWAADVDLDDQQRATELFYEGNELLRDSLFAKAAAKYREALKHWDHPRIHYNLALALMNLERPIEAYQTFEKAMRFGPEALDPEKFQQARSYHNLFGQQIAHLEIHCDEPGAEIALDGEVLFRGPGTYRGLVQIGEHRLVASKPAYATVTRTLALKSGERKRVALSLIPLDRVTREVTPPAYKWSWATAGIGVALAAAGGFLHWRSMIDYEQYDSKLADKCETGCRPEDQAEFIGYRDRADLERAGAIAAYSVGATAVITGLVLAYVYRPYRIRIDIDGDTEPVAITPLVTPDAAGLSAVLRF